RIKSAAPGRHKAPGTRNLQDNYDERPFTLRRKQAPVRQRLLDPARRRIARLRQSVVTRPRMSSRSMLLVRNDLFSTPLTCSRPRRESAAHLSHLEADDLLALLAEPLDAERHDVAGLEPDRVGLHAERDAGRRAGGDDVARLHHEELRA